MIIRETFGEQRLKNTQPCLHLVEESEEKFRKIAENSLVGMFIYKEYFIYVNKAFVEVTGYSEEELLKMHPWDLVDNKHKNTFKRYIYRRLKGEKFKAIHNDSLLVTKDQEFLNVKISAETIYYDGGYAGIGIAIDISDIVKKNQIIKVLMKALSQSDDIVFITDVKGVIQYTNSALNSIYGYADNEVIGKTPAVFRSNAHPKEFYRQLWQTILNGDNYHNVIINKTKDDTLLYMDTKITAIEDELNEKINYFVVTARDITKRVLIEQKLEQLATTDVLTHTANRYQILKYFDEYIARSQRLGYSFSILLFDIDLFKQINDEYGHYVGDIILKEFSDLIVKNIRSIDKFGRWGGEEFLLLLEGTTEEDAFKVAEKLRKKVEEYKFHNSYNITVSIGGTVYKLHESKDECLKRADKALYTAKENGRNRVIFD